MFPCTMFENFISNLMVEIIIFVNFELSKSYVYEHINNIKQTIINNYNMCTLICLFENNTSPTKYMNIKHISFMIAVPGRSGAEQR